MDLMDLGRGYPTYERGVSSIKSSSLLVAFEKDALIPIQETAHLSNLMKEEGIDVKFEQHPSIFGHDSFLKEYSWLCPKVRDFLAKEPNKRL
jgi:homoserine acetyltransferase